MSCATDSKPARTERKPLHRHRFTDSSIAVVVFAELDVSSWCHWFLIARRYRTRCSNAFGAGALDSDDKVAVVKPGPIRSHPEGFSAAGLQPSSLSNPLMSCAKAAMPPVIDQIPSSRRALIAMLRSVARI